MRIVAGRLGGRSFASPHSRRTHPMSDKMRGALFNVLGDIGGLDVLDAFAGSGALSFEAISRGAASALAIENDKPAQRAISENVAALGLEPIVTLVSANCGSWSDNNLGRLFGLVLADPPYDKLQPHILSKLARHLQPEGLYVLSWPGGVAPPDVEGCHQVAQKVYGDAQLIFYRRDG